MWIAESSGHAFIHSVNIDRAPSHGMGRGSEPPWGMPFTVYKTVYKTQEDKGQPLPWGGGTVRRLQNGNTQDGMLDASGPESSSILLPFSGNLQKDATPKRGT